MPLASLRCRSARFDVEMLNQKVKIATLKIVYGDLAAPQRYRHIGNAKLSDIRKEDEGGGFW